MWIEKLGSYFVDVSKYILTGVVISSLFKDFEDKVLIYSWNRPSLPLFGRGSRTQQQKGRKGQKGKGEIVMGVYLAFLFVGVPCMVFLAFCLTGNGKKWLRQNDLL